MLAERAAMVEEVSGVRVALMCRLWYVLSGCSKLTELRLLSGGHFIFGVLFPEWWHLVPYGSTSVKFEGDTSLGFLFFLDGLRELNLNGGDFAELLTGYGGKEHEVDIFLMHTFS